MVIVGRDTASLDGERQSAPVGDSCRKILLVERASWWPARCTVASTTEAHPQPVRAGGPAAALGKDKLVVLGLGHMDPELFPGPRADATGALLRRGVARVNLRACDHRLAVGPEKQDGAVEMTIS